jgi:hypothetical protein
MMMSQPFTFPDIKFELDGRIYCWECDLSVTIASESCRWSGPDAMEPSTNKSLQLNRKLIDDWGERLAATMIEIGSDRDCRRFCAILELMGARDDDFQSGNLKRISRYRHVAAKGKSGAPEQSPLCALGYRVGKHGLFFAERRSILEKAYFDELPFVHSDSYMQEWGKPGSETRLERIANHLADRCRQDKHRATDCILAIEHYEDDLRWLKQAYYHEHMHLNWPNTMV